MLGTCLGNTGSVTIRHKKCHKHINKREIPYINICWCLGPLSDCGGVCLNCSKQAPSGSIAVHIQDFDHLCLAALSLHISAPCTPLLQQHLSPELHTSLPTFPCTLHLHSCTSALLSPYLSTTMALHPKQCTFCGMSGHLADSCFIRKI